MYSGNPFEKYSGEIEELKKQIRDGEDPEDKMEKIMEKIKALEENASESERKVMDQIKEFSSRVMIASAKLANTFDEFAKEHEEDEGKAQIAGITRTAEQLIVIAMMIVSSKNKRARSGELPIPPDEAEKLAKAFLLKVVNVAYDNEPDEE